MTMRILGLDPGTRNAGIVVVERDSRGWLLARHAWIRPLKNCSTADDRARLISAELSSPEDIHCICSEKQTGPSVGNQDRGKWAAGNLGLHEIVGRAKHEAYIRRIPFIEQATSTVVKAVTGSGNIRGGVNYKALRRAILAQVRGVPDDLSEHELMAIAVAVAGARTPGDRRCA